MARRLLRRKRQGWKPSPARLRCAAARHPDDHDQPDDDQHRHDPQHHVDQHHGRAHDHHDDGPCRVRSNGDVEDGEECDDGNQDDTDGCTTACTTCGNRQITSPETCDDGNLVDEDFCPSDCKVDFCQPSASEITALVTLSTPDVAALTVFVDYPEGQVTLQGVGGDIPPGILIGPGSATTQGFDFDHALRVVAFDLFNFGATTMATVKFNGCQGSPAPQAQDFTCRLEGNATDENFAVVPGVTCSVTLQ